MSQSDIINSRQIQWFPGHMTKTLRLMEKEIRNVDCVLQILDARIPLSSLNPEIERITAGKPHLYVLNKSDLADPEITKQWLAYFKSAGAGCIAMDSKQRGRATATKGLIEKELSALMERRRSRGMVGAAIRVMIVGIPNVGKSTLLKILAGRLARTGGSVSSGSLTRLGYYSQQQTETLDIKGTVLGEMRRLSDPRTTEEELMSVLGLFLLGQGYFDRFISTLSGGERSRLALAVLFLARCNLLVLDEPTNHLDLESREALIEALDNFDGTLLVVAHDRHLLAEVVDEIWEITDRGIHVYEGGFEEYDAARHAAKAAEKAAKSETAAQDGSTGLSREDLKRIKREQAEQRNALYKKLKPLQEKYRRDEADMEATLTRLGEVENLLADPDVYADGAKASALLREFHELQTRSEGQLEALGELEAQISALEAQRAALSLGAEE